MSAFKPEALAEKISKLNATQQSIETVSQWCIFFRKDAKRVVATWEAEFSRTKDLGRRLALVYLANDILQNSRKKGPQFVNEFYHKLPPAVHQLLKYGDGKVRDSMTRMIRVWEERRVFGSSGLKPFTDLMQDKPKPEPAAPSGRGRHILLQGSDASVERLDSAVQEAAEVAARCDTLAQQCSAILAQDVTAGSAIELRTEVKPLQQYVVALQNDLGHRERILGILAQLALPHEQARKKAEEQLSLCQNRISQFQGLLQAAAPAAEAPSRENGADQSAEPMLEDRQAAEAVPGPPPPPSEAQPATDAAVHGRPALDGNFSAADLVAQLSQSGTSAQMLLDALAALPKENGPPPLQGGGREEVEYDPELGM